MSESSSETSTGAAAGQLLERMETLRRHILHTREHLLSAWRPLTRRRTLEPSAENLASYLAMRQADLRDLQAQLTPWGLSSLGRCEFHVDETIETVIATLRSLYHLEHRAVPEGSDLAGPKVRVAETSFKKRQRFFKGDKVLMVRDNPGSSREFPYQFSCTLKEAYDAAGVGDMVWVDDGILGARVELIRPEGIELVVEQVGVEGERIRPEKGINFPDTPLDIPALTEKDLKDLDFVADNTDIIALSFVQTRQDVEHLLAELEARVPDPDHLARIAIVEKIEKPKAVANLPELIVAAAGRQPLAVMMARGDLAVEIGFQRLAEIQEEIMWICEAAHVPVIWATQVFETFVKTGVPTRSEVTDAAMAERAECVMLNKGDFIVEAVKLLNDVLVRMEGHQFKKRAELRALKSWPIPITAPSMIAEESATEAGS